MSSPSGDMLGCELSAGSVAVMPAWPYAAVVTVPSSPTVATDGLSEAHVTPVAGPITAPDSSAKLARNGTRRASGTPRRDADSLSPAAITRIGQVTVSPGPGPFTVSVVFPARFPVRVPDAGSKPASEVSATVQRNCASGTGVLSTASPWTVNFTVP